MDFGLTREYELLRQMYREFAKTEVEPLAAEVDEEERFPEETVKKLAAAGFMGIPIPKEYGGEGGDDLGYAIAVEELSRECATTGVIVSAHTSLGAWPILHFGTEEQKQKYLVPLAKGEHLGAFGLTEPNAGTDASMQQTTAVLDGDHYILNGSKIFITNAGKADTYIVMAMTDKSKGTRGITAFIVDKDFEGFSVGLPEKKMGIRGSSSFVFIFEVCNVPVENSFGAVGFGFLIAMQTLDGGRIGIASQTLGIAAGALDYTIEYERRKQFGRNAFLIPKHTVSIGRPG